MYDAILLSRERSASCAPDPGAHDVPPGHFSRAAAVKYFFTINGSPPDYLREMLVLANEMFNSPPVFEWVLLLSFHMAARSAEANMPHDARVRHTAARSAEDNVPPDDDSFYCSYRNKILHAAIYLSGLGIRHSGQELKHML
jgi:hypothetical protein